MIRLSLVPQVSSSTETEKKKIRKSEGRIFFFLGGGAIPNFGVGLFKDKIITYQNNCSG